MLLVLGASLLVGGLKNGRQRFDAHVAGISATMLALAVVALSLEALFSTGPHAVRGEADKDALSAALAVVLLVLYGLYVLYTVFLHKPGYLEAGANVADLPVRGRCGRRSRSLRPRLSAPWS